MPKTETNVVMITAAGDRNGGYNVKRAPEIISFRTFHRTLDGIDSLYETKVPETGGREKQFGNEPDKTKVDRRLYDRALEFARKVSEGHGAKLIDLSTYSIHREFEDEMEWEDREFNNQTHEDHNE